MKLNLEINLPDDVLVVDVQSFMASLKYVLRGIFPSAKIRTTFSMNEKNNSRAKLGTPPNVN